MTLCSIPFWIILIMYALKTIGLPSPNQLAQSFLVALFSGVIATILFFKATEIVKDDPRQLAVVEVTPSGEVVFTILIGVLVLGDAMPNLISMIGIGIIILGMIMGSLSAK